MTKSSKFDREIGEILQSSRKLAHAKKRQLAREVKEALSERGFSGSPRPWSLAFDSRPYLKQIEAHKRTEKFHRKRIQTYEDQSKQLQDQLQSAAPRQQASLRRRLASIPGKILEQRAAIDVARAASGQVTKDLELARSSQAWERKIETAKKREARVVAVREGITVVGQRIGTDPRAEGHPRVLPTTAPRYYAGTPEFYIGGPESRIGGDPETVLPHGTTSIWQSVDEGRIRARHERRQKPTKTSAEWYEHDVRVARERQIQEQQARARFEQERKERLHGSSPTLDVPVNIADLPTATTRIVKKSSRATSFLRGLMGR
jgi:hypothetical protein